MFFVAELTAALALAPRYTIIHQNIIRI